MSEFSHTRNWGEVASVVYAREQGFSVEGWVFQSTSEQQRHLCLQYSCGDFDVGVNYVVAIKTLRGGPAYRFFFFFSGICFQGIVFRRQYAGVGYMLKKDK